MVSRVDRGAVYVAIKMQWNVKKILTPVLFMFMFRISLEYHFYLLVTKCKCETFAYQYHKL